MIDAVMQMRLDEHGFKCNHYAQNGAAYMDAGRRGGNGVMVAVNKFRIRTDRHPFNIITEEIYGD